VYVTLEPCSHYGRTPPCVNALIEAQVGRVIVAMEDPDSKVKGKGIDALRNAGIRVDLGLCQSQAIQLLEPYSKHRTHGIPYCIGKAAVSIDGRMAAQNGSSKWITGPEARRDVHKLRSESQAIVVGANTAMRDLPSLTVRDVLERPFKAPLRVLFDQEGKVPAEGPLFDISLAPTLVFTSSAVSEQSRQAWCKTGAEVEVLPLIENGSKLDLVAAMQILAKKGALQVLIEGGPGLLGSFFQAKLLDRLVVYIGPRLLGEQGFPLMRNLFVQSIENAPALHLSAVQKFGDSIRSDWTLSADL